MKQIIVSILCLACLSACASIPSPQPKYVAGGFFDPQPALSPRPYQPPSPPMSWEQRKKAHDLYFINTLSDSPLNLFKDNHVTIGLQPYDLGTVGPYMAASRQPDLGHEYMRGEMVDRHRGLMLVACLVPMLAVPFTNDTGRAVAIGTSTGLLLGALGVDLWAWTKRTGAVLSFNAALQKDLDGKAQRLPVDPATGKSPHPDLPPTLADAEKNLIKTRLYEDWRLQIDPFMVGKQAYDHRYIPYFLTQSGREDLLVKYKEAKDSEFWAAIMLVTGIVGVSASGLAFTGTPQDDHWDARVGVLVGSLGLSIGGLAWSHIIHSEDYPAIEKDFNDGLKLRLSKKF